MSVLQRVGGGGSSASSVVFEAGVVRSRSFEKHSFEEQEL